MIWNRFYTGFKQIESWWIWVNRDSNFSTGKKANNKEYELLNKPAKKYAKHMQNILHIKTNRY